MKLLQVGTRHSDLPDVTANQHHNQVHDHADHTDATAYVAFIPRAAQTDTTSTIVGAAPDFDGVSSLTDGVDNKFVWYWIVPAGYVSSLAFTIWWYTLGGAASGNYSCRLNMRAMVVATAIGTAGTTTTIMIAERNDSNIGSQAITAPITTLTPGDLVRIGFSRLSSTDAANDTATGNMRVIALVASFTNNN